MRALPLPEAKSSPLHNFLHWNWRKDETYAMLGAQIAQLDSLKLCTHPSVPREVVDAVAQGLINSQDGAASHDAAPSVF